MDIRHQKMYAEQGWYSEEIIAPLFNEDTYTGKYVLEIGSAEGGGLKHFAQKGAICHGIEYSRSRYANAVRSAEIQRVSFLNADITDQKTYESISQIRFNYIIVRDVIEHIPDQAAALHNIYDLVCPGGKVFISFPPKYSPFAGHQQNTTRFLCKLPYIYLFPENIYRWYLERFKQKPGTVDNLLLIKKTRISINKFEKIVKDCNFRITVRNLYFSRPGYEYRYGWKRKKNRLGALPVLRELLTQGADYILEK